MIPSNTGQTIPTLQERADGFSEQLRLAIEIADSACISDIESWCGRTPDAPGGWYDISPDRLFDDYERMAVVRAATYLTLRGKLEVDLTDPQRVRLRP